MLEFLKVFVLNKSLTLGLLGGAALFLLWYMIKYSKQKKVKDIMLTSLGKAAEELFPEFLDKGLSNNAIQFFKEKGRRIESFEEDLRKPYTFVLDPKIFYRLGNYNLWKEDYNSALDYFKKAQGLDSENKEIIFGLATALMGTGICEEAIKHFEELKNKDFQVADCYYNIGWALDELKDYKGAIKAYQKSYDLKPKNYWNKYNIACALTKMGEYDTAIETLREMIDQGQENVKDYAKEDQDFKTLKEDKEYGKIFLELIGA